MRVPEMDPRTVCAVVLAGGRAIRMGGVDKGLQTLRGQTLAAIALERLRLQRGGAPGLVAVNANRHVAHYEGLGVPVWQDTVPDYAGPLAGMLAAMQHCQGRYDYLLTVPCDSPLFPLDLLERLGESLLAHQVPVAMPLAPDMQDAGTLRPQPVFCLVRTDRMAALQSFLASGERKIGAWTASIGQIKVPFNAPGDDPHAFANVNTVDELHLLEKA